MALKPTRNKVIGMVRDKMLRHSELSGPEGLDWTCAAQAVAMEIAWNEQELLETLKSSGFDLALPGVKALTSA